MSNYPKMDPEVKSKWVAALRSGEFKQGKYELRDPNGCNCCLGVLAEINGVEHYKRDERSSTTFYKFPNEELEAAVPDDYCGLKSEVIGDLIQRNDTGYMDNGKFQQAMTFPEIADFIEKNL